MTPGDDPCCQNTEAPSYSWRATSYQTILSVAWLSRVSLFVLNKAEIHGLPRFLELLQSRSNYQDRCRGLVTVSNHVSVVDDPLIWGALPFSFAAFAGYQNHRWMLGSHDICFTGVLRSHFFTFGQTLPAHRLAHSPHGGLAQPTLTEAVRMLSKISVHQSRRNAATDKVGSESVGVSSSPSWPRDCVDPFSDVDPAPAYRSSPDDNRYYLAPSRYACNSYSWIHVFPEGMIHQSPQKYMRYFKWGVARLILEPPECPDVVPMFIDGSDQIMNESRGFPRFLPRLGKKVSITFGRELDVEAVFGDLRKRWQQLCEDVRQNEQMTSFQKSNCIDESLGILSDTLLHGAEAIDLRKECTLRIRREVLKLRRDRGYPDEDEAAALPETWHGPGADLEDGRAVTNPEPPT